MDLQEFVTKALSQISLGVTNAKTNDDRIAPKIGLGGDNPKVLRTFHGADGVFLVEFDVAVTTAKGAAGAITVLPVASAKGEAKGIMENSSVSRVKFSVPIGYW
jgi:hypothetical protein